MKYTKEFINALGRWEGRRNEVYICSAGYSTIGIGHKLTKSELSSGKILIGNEKVYWREGLTDEQIDFLALQDLRKCCLALQKYVTVELSQCQMEALASFIFNVGITAFKNSTLLSVLNAGHYDKVPKQLQRWVYASGKVSQGLINRRAYEISWWHRQAQVLDN